MSIYLWIVLIISFYFLFLTIINILYITSNTYSILKNNTEHVTVCIPARNEEKNIEKCIRSLMNQSYENYDVIVLNDNSSDLTENIIKKLVAKFPSKLRMIKGRPLPLFWTGKVYAMNQLVQEAKGEYLLFTDADTIHNHNSIGFALTNLKKNNADMLSGFIKEDMKSFGEQITVPLMYILISFVIPLFLNKITSFIFPSVAVGQYIMIKKNVLKNIGGYESLKNEISEDIVLARLVKQAGYKTIFVDCKQAAKCRMYESYQESVNGIIKNIFSFMNNKTFILFSAMMIVVLFLVLPFPLFLFSFANDVLTGYEWSYFTIFCGMNVFIMFLVWLILALYQNLPMTVPFLYPILFLNLTYMAILSYNRSISGSGFIWKDRILR